MGLSSGLAKRHFAALLGAAIGVAAASTAAGQTYYVSPTGNDSNSGTSASDPWQSLTKVDATTFTPGSQILFQDGGNWYGQQLIASSSGTTSAPITYGNYGTGADPTFWGSVIVPTTSFSQVGSTNAYFEATTTPVNSFFVNHQFTHSAALVSGQSTYTGNINYVENTPNTWYYGGTGTSQGLYVNTGGALANSNVYTAAVVGNGPNPSAAGVVYSNNQSYVTFQNLTVQESAAYNAGYGFSAFGGAGVTFLNDTSIAAGKHSFAAIDTTNFLGQGLNVSYLMPDQGVGGATPYVSYADTSVSNTTNKWVNDTSSNANGPYEVFYTHQTTSASDPTPISNIVIQNMNSSGGPGIAGGTSPGETITVTGGSDNNGPMTLSGGNWTLNGMLLTGANASVRLNGSNNIVENLIINGAAPSWNAGNDGAIIDNGTNNIIRYNTVVLGIGQYNGQSGAAIALETNTTNSQIYANIIDTPFAAFFQRSTGTPEINAFDNLFSGTSNPQVIYFDNASPDIAITSWPTTISYYEQFGNPQFVNATDGNFTLMPGSKAAYVFDPTTGQYVMYDYYGTVRPGPGSLDSVGAIEVPEPSPVIPLLVVFAMLLILSQRSSILKKLHRIS